MNEVDEKRLAARDRRRLAVMSIIVATLAGALAFTYGMLLRATNSQSGFAGEPVGAVEIPVARAEWSRFFAAADRFATEQGFYSRGHEYGVPVTEKSDWINVIYWREGGPWMTITKPIGKDFFQVHFHDVGGTGAWRQVQAGFMTRVVEAGGFAR